MGFQIAIDGPAGAGKSTIAKIVANRLGFLYVDTGAMYRAAALFFKRCGTDTGSEEAVARDVKNMKITLQNDSGTQRVFLDGEDVTGEIRTQEIGYLAALTSQYPCVRSGLTGLQKKIAEENPVVMDGRDIGTQVLPDAELKIFLTAGARCRAERRLNQLREKGDYSHSLEEIEEEVRKRDEQDMNRKTAPLKQAEDAVRIDSSGMSVQEVVDRILEEVRKRTEIPSGAGSAPAEKRE